ncbi:Cell surface glycan-binding lipoprotein, utilization system for glycans and polysaccharides (PUL), SusD family [hydrothermal vent metagenome]|uniref:Cell surface glycan-binding lipoprotein, utilization system for glycans and polysaccharides (PUL), SusD family n=1 Tax=hydrothermal vent metagenome TaxID=652676 RepID=A0A3B0U6M8_9ZZZZ
MKKIIKYVLTVFIAGTFLNSCETTDLNLQVSPNDLAADQADPNLLLNSIQLAYASNMQTFNNLGAQLTRIDYMFGRNYFNNYPGDTFDGVWERTYSSGVNLIGDDEVDVGIYTNVSALQAIDAGSDTDYSFHIAVGQTLKAHMLLLLVDYLGEAVFTQANNPDEFPAPLMDEGSSVYAAALALLDEAGVLFAAEPAIQGAEDFFYAGDTAKWVKLVNTLKLKAAVTTGDSATFNSIVAADNYISDTADDFEWQFGSRENAPDNRHPDYSVQYTPTGARQYRSLWLMDEMLQNSDPRRQYYFYRQNATTPGADDSDGPDEQVLVCSLIDPTPLHYAGFAYCYLEEGYWGRAHGNDEGGPPDNFLRTATGVYPIGGNFDDSRFSPVGLGQGGQGAGIEPIILAQYVDFWQGQNAIATGGDATPFLRDGIERSIAKAQGFGAMDGNADLSTAPSEAAVTLFVDGVMADYAAATGDAKMNIFSEQYWVAMYGGAAEAYNFYRRTGFPKTLSPNWEADPGSFPRTFLYPQSEVITNPNLTQRTDMNTQVFWDTNPPGPAFPSSN